MEWVDTSDLEKDADGNPIWAGYRTDLRNVSTGKKPNYELHPSTGRLALGSKPDNKGHWKQVKGGSINPAVRFIDHCLQSVTQTHRLLAGGCLVALTLGRILIDCSMTHP